MRKNFRNQGMAWIRSIKIAEKKEDSVLIDNAEQRNMRRAVFFLARNTSRLRAYETQ